jgi:DNA-binding MarR family transcriptional regulator
VPNKESDNMDNKRITYEIKTLDNYIKRIVINKSKNISFYPTSSIQIGIINYLIESDKDVYQKDLEKLFDIRRSTISGILKTMEKHNIIIRVDSKDDARVKIIKLTEESKDFHRKMLNNFKELDSELVSGISNLELEIFFDVIDKMKNNIAKLGK